jgi:hypothetical protein
LAYHLEECIDVLHQDPGALTSLHLHRDAKGKRERDTARDTAQHVKGNHVD